MLIAVAGLAGVGKTTAVAHLEAVGLGRQVYVGRYIHGEVLRRGLPPTPENEKRIRHEMRKQHGNDVFAKMVAADLADLPPQDTILLDAIYVADEADCYRRLLPKKLMIIGIEASVALRAARLESRSDRPLSRVQLSVRDVYEAQNLRIHEVVAGADVRITNDGSLADFTTSVEEIVRALVHSPK